MATLYELQGKYASLMAMAKDDSVDTEALADTLDSITDAIDVKAEGYVKVYKSLESDGKELAEEIKRLTERKAGLAKKAAYLKQRVLDAMHDTNTTKISTALYTIYPRKTASVVIESGDPKKLPLQYIKEQITYTADKDAIKRDLKAGKEIKGASLVYNESLQAR